MGDAAPLELPARWDELADASPDIDRFCSGRAWASAAHEAFSPAASLMCLAGRDSAAALLCASGPWRTRVLGGHDRLWGFGCPVVGPDHAEGAALLAELLRGGDERWQAALLTGFVPGSPREAAVRGQLEAHFRIGGGPTMTRRVADLSRGPDAWLARRGAHFRRNLRRACRAAQACGLTVEHVTGGPELVERAVTVERRSWKGVEGSGLVEPSMARFYQVLAARLAGGGGLRAGFARLDGRDVGFILGAVRGDTYRGLQLAHDERAARLSVGNLLQWHEIRAVAAEGVARYDLGMDMAYKVAWADEALTTRTLVVLR